MTKSKAAFLLTLCAWGLLLSSCQRALQLWVVPGSSADDLVFGFAESRKREEKVRPHSIVVVPCEALQKGGGGLRSLDEALWHASSAPGASVPAVNRITYGRDEHGLQTRRGPSPLAAGCYSALAYAHDRRGELRAAGLRFKVGADGAVVEVSRGDGGGREVAGASAGPAN